MEDNIVIVLDAGNYKSPEKVPFKAKVIEKFEHEIIVKSLVTGIEYELYYFQILESLDIEHIKYMLNSLDWRDAYSSFPIS